MRNRNSYSYIDDPLFFFSPLGLPATSSLPLCQFFVCFLEEIMHPFERVHNLLQNIYIYYLLYTFNHSFKSDTVLYHQKHTLFLKVLLLYLRLLLFLFDCRGFLSKHPVRSDFPESLQKVSLSAAAVTLVKSISQLAG